MHAGRKKRAIAGVFVAATATAIATGVWAQARQPQQTQTNPARRMGQQTVPPSTPPATGALRPWLQVADAQQPVRLSGLHVQGQGDDSRVTVLTREGGADTSDTAKRILGLLQNELR